MIKVTCKVPVYFSNSELSKPVILVHDSANDEYVTIEIEGKKAIVKANDIITAIKNCTHIASF